MNSTVFEILLCMPKLRSISKLRQKLMGKITTFYVNFVFESLKYSDIVLYDFGMHIK